jgi:hypothetical protein
MLLKEKQKKPLRGDIFRFFGGFFGQAFLLPTLMVTRILSVFVLAKSRRRQYCKSTIRKFFFYNNRSENSSTRDYFYQLLNPFFVLSR